MKITAESKYDIGDTVKVPLGERVIEAEITDVVVHIGKKNTTIIYHTDVVEIETVGEKSIIGKGTPRIKRELSYSDQPF